MVQAIILRLWSLRKEFIKYFVIGISAFVADIVCLYILKEWFNLSPLTSVILYLPPLTFAVFYFNKHWSFGAQGISHQQMIKFYLLSALNYAISIGWIYVVHDRLGVQYLIARTGNVALAVAWNFLLYKYWVYRT